MKSVMESFFEKLFFLAVLVCFCSHQGKCAEYAVLVAKAEGVLHQFCMIYYSEFKDLPEDETRADYMPLVNFTGQDGCRPLHLNLNGRIALIRQSNCSLENVVLNYKNAKASGILISTIKSKVDDIAFETNDTKHLDIIVAFISDATGQTLLKLSKPKLPLQVKLYTKKSVSFDYSLIVIWLVAVFTVAVGSYWSGIVKQEIYQHEMSKFPPTGSQNTEMEASLTKSDSQIEEESSLNVSPLLVTLFVVCMGVMLLLLYFFFQYLVFFIIGMFALASVVSIIGVLEPLIYFIPLGTTRIPKRLCPCFHGPLEIRQLGLIGFAISVSVTWVILRHQTYAWILQDILGVAFSINMLKTLRLPNLMICSVLLVLLFFYDIFFVFVTPFLTMKGESVMVEVAKGSNSQEQLPMVLRVPHFNNDSLSVCFNQFSLLGFGDILVPGLLIAYCHGFDLLTTRRRVYFVITTIFYGLGLVFTFVALYLMRTPQPALLYLVPATLVPVILVAWCRGQLREIWQGVKAPLPLPEIVPQHGPINPSSTPLPSGRNVGMGEASGGQGSGGNLGQPAELHFPATQKTGTAKPVATKNYNVYVASSIDPAQDVNLLNEGDTAVNWSGDQVPLCPKKPPSSIPGAGTPTTKQSNSDTVQKTAHKGSPKEDSLLALWRDGDNAAHTRYQSTDVVTEHPARGQLT